jgi:pantoate--beta-alanine ligase
MSLTVASDRKELAVARARLGPADIGNAGSDVGRRVALVPTMGALHDGHLALVRAARECADDVAVSIFVNPLQFGPTEDLDAYPRTLQADLELLEQEGVALAFVPTAQVMYGVGGSPAITVAPGPLGDELEGASRPGHFAGVLTVVAKLLNLVAPHCAVFGEKDYQQLVLIRRMVHDLDLPVEVVPHPTIREDDGLAMSSRNRYLSPAERRSAAALSAALQAGVGEAAAGGGPTAVETAARAVLEAQPDVDVDYLVLRDPDLGPAPDHGAARLLVAARVGHTRLIDNVPVTIQER